MLCRDRHTKRRHNGSGFNFSGELLMAKYLCPNCGGFAHTSGDIPSPSEWLLLSAIQWDALPKTVQSNDLYMNSRKLYKCVSCAAIAVFWNGFGDDPTWYVPHR